MIDLGDSPKSRLPETCDAGFGIGCVGAAPILPLDDDGGRETNSSLSAMG